MSRQVAIVTDTLLHSSMPGHVHHCCVMFITTGSHCRDYHYTSRSLLASQVVAIITARPVVVLITARPVFVLITARPVVVLITARPVVVLNTARPVVVSRHVAITTFLRSSRCGHSMERSSMQASGAGCVWWSI